MVRDRSWSSGGCESARAFDLGGATQIAGPRVDAGAIGGSSVSRRIFPARASWLALVVVFALAACETITAPDPDPGAGDAEANPCPDWEGPIFSVSPIEVGTLARITPLGTNNAIFPQAHTYWLTCDMDIVLPSERECHQEKQEIVAPGPGVVVDLDPEDDGFLRVMAPAGFVWTLGHVTPQVGRGDTIAAGQMVATMYYDHGFDFGMWQLEDSVTEGVANPARFSPFPPVHPVSEFEEPLRTELMAVIPALEGDDPFGQVYWDLPGTAMGAWFLEGAPPDASSGPTWAHTNLFLGRFQLRPSSRIMIVGEFWPEMPVNFLVIDPSAPDWEEITPARGRVAARVWLIDNAGNADLEGQRGTILVEMLADDRLRIEWFPLDEPVSDFTDGARIYTR